MALTVKLAELGAGPAAADPDGKKAWHLRNSRDKTADQLRQTAVLLGLTPASRGRIRASGAASEEESDDPLEVELRRRERV
ncbi:MAG: hypothetical protein JNM56_39815 [Planctomycetia bacterium]|nr:hypothetical protein [Planctomycetia bacterium]